MPGSLQAPAAGGNCVCWCTDSSTTKGVKEARLDQRQGAHFVARVVEDRSREGTQSQEGTAFECLAVIEPHGTARDRCQQGFRQGLVRRPASGLEQGEKRRQVAVLGAFVRKTSPVGSAAGGGMGKTAVGVVRAV